MNAKKLPLGSFCVPVLNEEENIDNLYIEFCQIAHYFNKQIRFELLFTDNHSNDSTWQKITDLAIQDRRVRGYRFGRNIGYQKSILYNLKRAKGNFAIQLDADLQEPKEVIIQFINLWLEGYKVVSGRRIRRSEGSIINTFRNAGYKALSKSSSGILKPNVGDFRLLDRGALKLLFQSKNPTPYLRGMISSLGFEEKFVDYHRKPRTAGVSKFPLVQILSLGWNGFLSFSKWPLAFVNFMIAIALLISMSLFGIVIISIIASFKISTEFMVLIMAGSLALLFSTIVNAIMLFYIKSIYEVAVGNYSIFTIDHHQFVVDDIEI